MTGVTACGCPACAGVHMCVSKREKLHSNGAEGQECVGVIKYEEDQAQLWYEGEADVQGVFEMGHYSSSCPTSLVLSYALYVLMSYLTLILPCIL